MTEQEAKTKWCPMVRAPMLIAPAIPGNKYGANAKCVGSDCMMWRWIDGVETDSGGYCGLAGARNI